MNWKFWKRKKKQTNEEVVVIHGKTREQIIRDFKIEEVKNGNANFGVRWECPECEHLIPEKDVTLDERFGGFSGFKYGYTEIIKAGYNPESICPECGHPCADFVKVGVAWRNGKMVVRRYSLEKNNISTKTDEYYFLRDRILSILLTYPAGNADDALNLIMRAIRKYIEGGKK